MTSSPAKKIALTFDDGPSPDNTPMLLDILSEYKNLIVEYSDGRKAEMAYLEDFFASEKFAFNNLNIFLYDEPTQEHPNIINSFETELKMHSTFGFSVRD